MERGRVGDYTGRFTLPDGRLAHGTLSLEANAPPNISMRPESLMPGGPHGSGFPEESEASLLVGWLDNNEEVVIGDAHLSEWFPDQFFVSGPWAVIGLDVGRTPDFLWRSITVSATGLELVLGNAIGVVQWPATSKTEPQRYSVDLRKDSTFESAANGVTVTAGFSPRYSINDPYAYSLTNFPFATFLSDRSITIEGWFQDWVRPFANLLALASGEPEHLRTVTVRAGLDSNSESRPGREISGGVFGSGIHQDDGPAARRVRKDGLPAVPLFTLDAAPPLAELIVSWRENVAELTAGTLYRLSLNQALPIRVRYLLLTEALEGLHAALHAKSEGEQEERHRQLRKETIDSLNLVPVDSLSGSARAFIKKNLPKKPFRSLPGRLQEMIKTLPGADERLDAWMRQTERLAAELPRSKRSSLHDRLGEARNILAHGGDLKPSSLQPGVLVLGSLLRGQLLNNLGFNVDHLKVAYDRMANEERDS